MGIRSRLANAILGSNRDDGKNTRDDDLPVKDSIAGAFDNASYNLAKGLKRSIIGPKGTIRGWFGIRRK